MSTWKTRDEIYHGTKWGYAVVALVIVIVLSLLGSIFYLIGEGMRGMEFDPGTLVLGTGIVIVIIIIIIILAWVFSHVYNFFVAILQAIWSLFNNIYLFVFTLGLIVILLSALFFAGTGDFQITLSNPLVIGILIVLFIIFIPFAIFIIDLFSYEHE